MTSEQKSFFEDLISGKNYLGAYHYLKELDIPKAERSAYAGITAQAIADDLASQARSNRERIVFLRSLLTYVLKDFPGLASLYREQLRIAQGREDLLGDLFRGVRNAADVAAGRKSIEEGVEDAAEDFKETLDQNLGGGFENLAKDAEKTLRAGIESINSFFTSLSQSPEDDAKKDRQEEQKIDVKVENADDPVKTPLKNAERADDETEKHGK